MGPAKVKAVQDWPEPASWSSIGSHPALGEGHRWEESEQPFFPRTDLKNLPAEHQRNDSPVRVTKTELVYIEPVSSLTPPRYISTCVASPEMSLANHNALNYGPSPFPINLYLPTPGAQNTFKYSNSSRITYKRVTY